MKRLKKPILTYLAFMSDINLVKIGKSKDFESRKNQLITANPLINSFYLIHSDVEKLLHNYFYELKIKGEWFIYEDKQIFLDEVKHILIDLEENKLL